jgi:hypothetical protein
MDLVKGLGFRKKNCIFLIFYDNLWFFRSEVAAVLRLGNWVFWSREIGK